MSPRPRQVDATGTRRRLEALQAIGHPSRVIVAAMGRDTRSAKQLVCSWRNRHRTTIATDIRDQVAACYPALAGQPGTSHRVLVEARLAGCLPPDAWAGVDIDDPDAQPYADDDDEDRAA